MVTNNHTDCQRFHYVREKEKGNSSCLVGKFICLYSTGYFAEHAYSWSHRILDHRGLNGMNSTRSTCVITVSNLVTWVSGKMKLQDVNENMLRKFTPLHKFKKDIFSKRIHINKKPPAGGNIHLSLQHWILAEHAYSWSHSFTESFAIDASGLDRMNNSRSTCVIIKSNLVTCCLGGSARSQRTADSTMVISY
ncbi:hypothetical protein T06_12998 [Trichinella sp. T6]|nr:hypothetical protein T06_12998 [Trichinella sp. T6]